MRKILSIILMAAITTAAYSQKPNERLVRLEEFLKKESSVHISHKQLNCSGRGIEHQWYTWFNEVTSKTPRFNFDEKISEAARQHLIESYDSINAARHQRVVTMLDSIRLTFALLGKDASESGISGKTGRKRARREGPGAAECYTGRAHGRGGQIIS